MGFPEWTLWGMGISALGALLMIGLALLAQSPMTLARMRLTSSRLDLRAKAFTSYGFALMLLAFGFFLAGVPIGIVPETVVTETNTPPAQTPVNIAADTDETGAGSSESLPTETSTPRPTSSSVESGSFGGSLPTATGTAVPEGTTPEPTATETPTPTSTNTPVATSTPTATPTNTPTSTASPTPTDTPTPTVTPTPIQGETAVITTEGNPISLRRSPGGQQILAQLQNGTIVLLQNGRANQGNILWREVRTTGGVLGWVPEEFLTISSP